jgi:uncharacterized protein YdhG (YjbR/CyaY superfamily)
MRMRNKTEIKKPLSVDDYIDGFPAKTQKILQQVRSTVKKAAPKAEEVISYGMPAYKLHGMLVYFAGYEKHIGFYALPSGNLAFKKELANYKMGKGSIQFPIDEPMPLKLITQIVKFRVLENKEKEKEKAAKKKK